jgi:hypothetical protein
VLSGDDKTLEKAMKKVIPWNAAEKIEVAPDNPQPNSPERDLLLDLLKLDN